MNFSLNNIATTNAYSTVNTLDRLPRSNKVNLDVTNAAIYWQIKQQTPASPNGDWGAEVYMTPGSRSLIRQGIIGIRVRSAVINTPAQVTVEVVQ